jgi:hypothetical protein
VSHKLRKHEMIERVESGEHSLLLLDHSGGSLVSDNPMHDAPQSHKC